MGGETDGVEIHFDPGRGELRLTCGRESFARLLNAVAAESGLTDDDVFDWPAAQHIEIEVCPQPKPTR